MEYIECPITTPPPSYFWMTQTHFGACFRGLLLGPWSAQKRNVLSVYHQGFFLFATLKAFYIPTEAKFTTSFYHNKIFLAAIILS